METGVSLRYFVSHCRLGFDYKIFWMTAVKFFSANRKHRHEILDEPKKQPNIIFIDKELTTKVILDCRTTTAHNSRTRTRLGLRHYDIILTNGQSVVKKRSLSEGENMQPQYSVLG